MQDVGRVPPAGHGIGVPPVDRRCERRATNPLGVRMSETIQLPENARCLKCGYLLHGLRESVCPECGRPFEPLYPTTFDAEPARRRRRRWVKRITAAFGILLLLYAFTPRRLLSGNMSFTCTRCGQIVSVSRWEPQPPRWIPFRYPGMHWTSRSSVAHNSPSAPCSGHHYALTLRHDFFDGGGATGTFPCFDQATINEEKVTPDTAPHVLESLMSP